MSLANTSFDWAIYADATFAGLSPLIPIPLVDAAFEWAFKRRIPRALVRRREKLLPTEVFREFNRSYQSPLESCVLLVPRLVIELIKRTSRKILYFLSINEAADRVSYYWHYAFLLDYALQVGWLEDATTTRLARLAMERLLRNVNTSPLRRLAEQVTTGTPHIFRTLRRALRGDEDEVLAEKKSLIARTWASFGEYFAELVVEYERVFAEVQGRELEG